MLIAASRQTLALAGVPKCRRAAICLTDKVDSLRMAISLMPLYVTEVHRTGDNVNLSWLAQAGVNYRVQYRTNLAAGTWLDLPGDVAASGATASKTDTSATDSQRFYRVRLLR